MPVPPAYAPGVPCWVDLPADDVEAAAAFYAAVVGFEPQPSADPAYGDYRMCLKDGRPVAAIAQKQDPSTPTAWNVYLHCDDADATVARAREAGGSVLHEVMDIPPFGRLAFLADPAGAPFGIWQPGEHRGAELVNEPGAPSWMQCASTDPEASAAFYASVFGIAIEEMTVDEQPMRAFMADGRPVAGLSGAPEGMPSHWSVHFGVTDADAAVAEARSHGVEVLMGPIGFQFGRSAMLRDPQGALVGLFQAAAT